MFLKEKSITTEYSRKSKLGQDYTYTRTKLVYEFLCDNCGSEFMRSKGLMDPRRANNNYFHVCPNCDAKRFAQTKGVDRRRLWGMTVDQDLDINTI